MNSVLLGLVLTLASLMAAQAGVAPTPTSQAVPASPSDLTQAVQGPQKYLFVVDVSTPMEPFSYVGRAALFEFIQGGLFGHMRSGDTFGIWPFNEGVFAGLYPMQSWEPSKAADLAGNVTRFLKNRELSGKSRLDYVVPVILNVVTNVGDLNVIIISNGKSKLVGTPFDKEINKTYQRRASEAKKGQSPFITLLLARQGQLVTAGVTLAGENIPMPPRPDPEPAPTNAPPAALAGNAPAPSKPQPKIREITNLGFKSTSPTAAVSAPTNSHVSVAATPTTPPPGFHETNPGPVFEELPGPQQTQALSVSVPGPHTAIQVQTTLTKPPAELGAEGTKQNAIEPAPAPTPTANPVRSLLEQLAPAPLPVAARESLPAASASQTNQGPLPVMTAMAPPSTASSNGRLYLGLGLGLIALTLGCLGVYWKVRRPPADVSFITQSMHRR